MRIKEGPDAGSQVLGARDKELGQKAGDVRLEIEGRGVGDRCRGLGAGQKKSEESSESVDAVRPSAGAGEFRKRSVLAGC